jgi:hypothetical protein
MIDAAGFGLKSTAREVIPISGDFSSVVNFAAFYPIEYRFFLAAANYKTYCTSASQSTAYLVYEEHRLRIRSSWF